MKQQIYIVPFKSTWKDVVKLAIKDGFIEFGPHNPITEDWINKLPDDIEKVRSVSIYHSSFWDKDIDMVVTFYHRRALRL